MADLHAGIWWGLLMLILGAVTLFLLLTTIVMMTNARYRGKEAAETTTHQ